MITDGLITRNLDLQNGLNEPFNSVEKDNNSRFLTINLTNGNKNFSVVGCQVFLHTAFDMTLGKSQIENEGAILDATTGRIKVEITSNMTPKYNCNQDFQVVVRKVNSVDDVDRITFPKFQVYIGERIIDDNYMIAENESEVLDDLHAINIELQDTIDRIGLSNDSSTASTLFGRIKQIYTYITGTLITTINNLVTRVGVANPTIADKTTVMNYIKKVENDIDGVDTKIGAQNVTDANRTTIMNFLKLIENKIDSANASFEYISQPTASVVMSAPATSNFPSILINGKGIVTDLSYYVPANMADASLKVFIDGVDIGRAYRVYAKISEKVYDTYYFKKSFELRVTSVTAGSTIQVNASVNYALWP